jgi:hypothetical protein
MKTALLIVVPFLTAAYAKEPAYDYQSICRSISFKHRAESVGKVITIRGTYEADIERAIVIPDKCSGGVGVGAISPTAEKFLDHDKSEIIIEKRGIFTGVLVREKSNGFQFYRDDGIRFNISAIRPISR